MWGHIDIHSFRGRQVKEMLANGKFQPSNNLFSSPVILVKKKDGTQSFYFDRRALNAVIFQENVPILTIDELLHE